MTVHCRQVNANTNIESTITRNTAYGIIDKRENIQLQANKCYKSVPPAQLTSISYTTSHEYIDNSYFSVKGH